MTLGCRPISVSISFSFAGVRTAFADYLNVTKPAIAMLNVFVGISCVLLAAGMNAPLETLVFVFAAGFFSAGGAGALNCYLERDLDGRMNRTKHRPIPGHRVSPETALLFGLVLSVGGVALAALFLNLLTAFFIGMGAVWYVFVYTLWLKPRTKWNIVIGGAAGSFSALAGWAAVTGSVGIEAMLVALLIFLWTPGHFWGLAIAKAKEYASAEVPMLPVVEGINRTSVYAAVSNALLFPFTILLFALSVAWYNIPVAAITAAILVGLNIRFLLANIRMVKQPAPLNAWRVFKLSAQYLFIVMILVVVAHIA
jgi:protoheme IX farnesyltransferase